MSTTATPPRPQPTPNAEPRPRVRVEPRAERTPPPSTPRPDAPVIVVHLRRPQADAWESRTDPLWEFGSFGCTGCHGGNLLRPARADEVAGARLAFAQGGPQGFRLMLVTPPVEIVRHNGRCEARWPRERMPFRYDRAPLLVNNTGASDVPALLDLLEGTRRRTWEARFSSRFRTRRTPLAEGLAAQVVEAYERALRDGGEAALAQTYEQALPWPPPQVDRDRWATYCALIESVGGRAPEG